MFSFIYTSSESLKRSWNYQYTGQEIYIQWTHNKKLIEALYKEDSRFLHEKKAQDMKIGAGFVQRLHKQYIPCT